MMFIYNDIKSKISEKEQRIVAEILILFMFSKNMKEVFEIWDKIYKDYGLCTDPFTGCPCSSKEYAENQLEYEKQMMIEKYGHCDGLE